MLLQRCRKEDRGMGEVWRLRCAMRGRERNVTMSNAGEVGRVGARSVQASGAPGPMVAQTSSRASFLQSKPTRFNVHLPHIPPRSPDVCSSFLHHLSYQAVFCDISLCIFKRSCYWAIPLPTLQRLATTQPGICTHTSNSTLSPAQVASPMTGTLKEAKRKQLEHHVIQ